MTDRKRRDLYLSDPEPVSRCKQTEILLGDPAEELLGGKPFKGPGCRIDGEACLFQNGRKALCVVAVLMRKQ